MDGVTLPDADWRHRPGLGQLAEVLGAAQGEARFVGGAVRDTLMGLPVAIADIDIATRHTPEEVVRRLKVAGIKAVPTGIAHGTVTAVLESGPVEVTTLRRDVSTDGRRATVAFTDDWREDAARRDFTINALYADPLTGEIFDYFEGKRDLDARYVRFIGDPLARIAEDHLRILRFFRFLARFGNAADPAGLEACTVRAKDLMALSRERIADELLKLLVAKDAVRVVGMMVERGILAPVLPEIGAEGVKRLATIAHYEEITMEVPGDAVRRLAALLPHDPNIGESVGARLKLSNAQRKRLVSALVAYQGSPYELAYRIGPVEATDRLLLSDVAPFDIGMGARHLRHWDVPKLPITGGALVPRGLVKGPEVARVLRQIEDQWIRENFPDAARVHEIADELVAQALRSVR